jgi:hypothetical protein
MQQPATTTPSTTFAGMLAAIAAPGFAAPGQKRPPVRDVDGLEDDIATLSYEHALQVPARYKAAEGSGRVFTLPPPVSPALAPLDPLSEPSTEPPDAGSMRIFEAVSVRESQCYSETSYAETVIPEMVRPVEPPVLQFVARPEPEVDEWKASKRDLRTVSITIRLNKAECAMVHKRANEAGLTVSAYLRSCTLEADSLRAMVKNTLAKLRTEAAKEGNAEGDRAIRSRFGFGWLRRFSPNGSSRVPVASA